jgi:methylmalonyl-CoA mutase cobalamin-binding subunit
VSNLLLLLGVGLHGVDLVFRLGTDVSGVVTTVVHKLLALREVHHVGANTVHEVLRVRGEDENMVVGGQVSLEPYDGTEIQM